MTHGQMAASLKSKRAEHRLSLRELGKLLSVPFTTLSRIERGTVPMGATFAKIQEWLEPNGIAADTITAVNATIFADTKLTPDAKKALSELFAVAYRQFTKGEK